MNYNQLVSSIHPELEAPLEKEREYHRLSRLSQADRKFYESASWLIDVYANPDKFVMQEENENESVIPKLLAQRREAAGYRPGESAIVSRSQFNENFRKLTSGCLDGLDWTNIYVAGGSVLGCLLKNPIGFQHSDIDMFLRADSEAEADALLRRIFDCIKANSAKFSDQPVETYKSMRTVNVRAPFRNFQVVCQLNWSLMDVLFKFDVDCCCAGFDGERIWVSERCQRSIVKRYNLLDLSYALPGRYERRLLKYSKRGFPVAIPGLDKSQVDPRLWAKRFTDPGVEGLSKLLLLDKVVSEEPDFGDAKHFFVTDIDNAISGGESWCRVCHLPKEDHVEDPSAPPKPPHMAKYDVSTSISWEREGVVFQDIEKVDEVKRRIDDLQVLQRAWEQDVYNDGASSAPPSNILTSVQGIVTPKCYCGMPCGIRTVKKMNYNHGKRFFSCGQRSGPGVVYCGFFAWIDENSTPSAVIAANSDSRSAPSPKIVFASDAAAPPAPVEESSAYLLAIGRLFKLKLITVSQRGQLKDAVLNGVSDARLRDILSIAVAAGTDENRLRDAASSLVTIFK
eukprot:TRINITY_DN4727_c0_g1_i1.p1 TRINITY_DN4727_c0_g1~~TRINITY_DN4727_c0_g1_i1.p1  ORF type:complete len:567 (-),score=100.96 TRINITY_DN4727_c0_g1_i1:498-2198(-)